MAKTQWQSVRVRRGRGGKKVGVEVVNKKTGEIMETATEKPLHERPFTGIAQPAASPCPMTGHRINQYADSNGVDHVHGELGTFGHSARYNCG